MPGSPKSSSIEDRMANSETKRRPFAGKLKLKRENSGLSQESLAARIGVSKRMIQKYEAGQCFPGTKNLILLCEVLKTDPLWLVSAETPEGTEEPSVAYERVPQTPIIGDKENPFLGAKSLVEGIKAIFDQSGIDMFKTQNLLMFHLLIDLFSRELNKRDPNKGGR